MDMSIDPFSATFGCGCGFFLVAAKSVCGGVGNVYPGTLLPPCLFFLVKLAIFFTGLRWARVLVTLASSVLIIQQYI